LKTDVSFHGPIPEAIETIRHFIAETTGQAPDDREIADALRRYFVLNEIRAHILMNRTGENSS
jgi:hypothetical protein